MHGCGLAFAGTDSRGYLPARLPIFFPRRASPSEGNSQVLCPKSTRIPSASVRAKAAVANEPVVSNASEMTFYELLGVPETGSMVEIKKAYKQMALKYHPDVSPPDRIEEYTKTFIKVQEAYETLSDPSMRALYDTDMARGLHLAFSARNRGNNHEGMDEKSEWRNRWQDQLSELMRRSMNQNSRGNIWGARMRRQRDA